MSLYDLLGRYDASPVVRLNHAVAPARLGPDRAGTALADVEALADQFSTHHRALAPTTNDAERRLLSTRLHRHPLGDGS